jgi:hypothetical protein
VADLGQGNGIGPDAGSAEAGALQLEMQQDGLAEHLHPLAVSGEPTVEDPQHAGGGPRSATVAFSWARRQVKPSVPSSMSHWPPGRP